MLSVTIRRNTISVLYQTLVIQHKLHLVSSHLIVIHLMLYSTHRQDTHISHNALAAEGGGQSNSSLHTIIERSSCSTTDKEKYATESLAYRSPSIQADEVIFECNKHTGQEALYVLRSFLAS